MPLFVLLALVLFANCFFSGILVFIPLNILDFLRVPISYGAILVFLFLLGWCFDD